MYEDSGQYQSAAAVLDGPAEFPEVCSEARSRELQAESDEQLMRLLCVEESLALGELVTRHQRSLFLFSYSFLKNVHEAEEITQEAFLRLYAERDRFDCKRKLRPWLFRIARNLCLTALRRRKVVPMLHLEESHETAGPACRGNLQSTIKDPRVCLIEAERRQQLLAALDELPGTAREIVELRYFHHLSYKEISETIGASEGAVRVKLCRALKMLRNDLQQDESAAPVQRASGFRATA